MVHTSQSCVGIAPSHVIYLVWREPSSMQGLPNMFKGYTRSHHQNEAVVRTSPRGVICPRPWLTYRLFMTITKLLVSQSHCSQSQGGMIFLLCCYTYICTVMYMIIFTLYCDYKSLVWVFIETYFLYL